MNAALLGTKIGMTRVPNEHGNMDTVTVVKAGPCVVLQVKSGDTDGYEALQLGFEDAKPHRSTRPMIGHCANAGSTPKRYVREIRLDGPSELEQGAVLTVEQFAEGIAFVDVVGTTKGRGFAGVMRRFGFGGQPASHGTERKHRSPGSIGGGAPRGRGRGVKKGRRMSGHMGSVRRTATNLPLIGVDAEHHLLLIRGSVPGANGTLVLVKKAKKGAK